MKKLAAFQRRVDNSITSKPHFLFPVLTQHSASYVFHARFYDFRGFTFKPVQITRNARTALIHRVAADVQDPTSFERRSLFVRKNQRSQRGDRVAKVEETVDSVVDRHSR